MRPDTPLLPIAILSLGMALSGTQSLAQEVGVALPMSDTYRLFGTQFMDGLGASPLGQATTFQAQDTSCNEDGGRNAAEQFATASFVIGFPCVDALDAAQATGLLENKTILVPLTAAIGNAPATNTSRHGRQIHFAPTPDQEAEVLATYITENWRDASIALLDDGTLEGRGSIDLLRVKLADQQIEPIYVTNYRPQLTNQVGLVRLIQRSGATHVILGGDRFDASVIAEAMDIVGYRFQLAGYSALAPGSAEGTLPEGTLYTALPDFSRMDSAQGAVADLEEAGIIPEGFTLWGYVAGELASQWLATPNPGQQPQDGTSWPTIMGDLTFQDGQLATNLYHIHQVRSDGEAPLESGAPSQ